MMAAKIHVKNHTACRSPNRPHNRSEPPLPTPATSETFDWTLGTVLGRRLAAHRPIGRAIHPTVYPHEAPGSKIFSTHSMSDFDQVVIHAKIVEPQHIWYQWTQNFKGFCSIDICLSIK